jgi:putative membrane protein
MHYLTQNWSFDPFLIVAIVLVIWHEIGLARLAGRSGQEETRRRRLRSLLFYAGLVVMLLAVTSPLEYWAYDYFFVHMIQHLLLMFAAPTLIVAGAPWQPLAGALPGRVLKEATTSAWARPVRAVAGWLLRPWVAIVTFSVVMVAWHIPVLYDLADRNLVVQIWLSHASYLVAGTLFWLQFIDSPPYRRKLPVPQQALALIGTNVVMWLLAMSMGIMSSSSWYPVYDHIAGVTLPPFADQQIGAGILWVCGDFWALPAMIFVVRRLIQQDGSFGSAVDKMLKGGGSKRYEWANRG